MRDQILEWLKKKRYYREMLNGEAESTLSTKLDDLGNRIANLEVLFEQFIKQKNARKGKGGASSSKVESSSKKE